MTHVKVKRAQLDRHQFDKKRIGLLRSDVVVMSHWGTRARYAMYLQPFHSLATLFETPGLDASRERTLSSGLEMKACAAPATPPEIAGMYKGFTGSEGK